MALKFPRTERAEPQIAGPRPGIVPPMAGAVTGKRGRRPPTVKPSRPSRGPHAPGNPGRVGHPAHRDAALRRHSGTIGAEAPDTAPGTLRPRGRRPGQRILSGHRRPAARGARPPRAAPPRHPAIAPAFLSQALAAPRTGRPAPPPETGRRDGPFRLRQSPPSAGPADETCKSSISSGRRPDFR